MKRKVPSLFILCMMFSTLVYSQRNIDKSKLDLDLKENHLKSLSTDNSRYCIKNKMFSYSMLKSGYFTLGTEGGFESTVIDDNCQITYGHPYSYVSFPYLMINNEKLLLSAIGGNESTDLTVSGDTLTLNLTGSEVSVKFRIFSDSQNDDISLSLSCKNLTDSELKLGMGFLLDFALGKWGDGNVYVNDDENSSKTEFTPTETDVIDVFERSKLPYGMGVHFDFKDILPDKVAFDNWDKLYYGTQTDDDIYDLASAITWKNIAIAAGETKLVQISLELLEVQEYLGLFGRFELPTSLSIENNILFPQEINAVTEIINTLVENVSNVTLDIEETNTIDSWQSEVFSLSNNSSMFLPAKIAINEIYEDLVETLTLTIHEDDMVYDQIEKKIFIPASPFSNEGLEVIPDSVFLTEPNQINIKFTGQNEESGSKLYSLKNNNIFLYEDDIRINDFTIEKDKSGGSSEADIVFILDVTGSMGDEIDKVKDNLVEFADSLEIRNIDYRLAMVTFLDNIENVYDFTNDIMLFKSNVAQQYAHGGGDEPENSLDALVKGTEFTFRPEAKRVFIWITDATYHINNGRTQQTKESVINLLQAKGITTHTIGPSNLQTDFYDQINMSTGGSFYDIYGNFRDIMLSISRLPASGDYIISYNTTSPNQTHDIKIELHYAGLGGNATVTFDPSQKKSIKTSIEIHTLPNPSYFNSTISMNNLENFEGKVTYFSVTGQIVMEHYISSVQTNYEFNWTKNTTNKTIDEGMYIVNATLTNTSTGQTENLSSVIIFINE